MNRYTDRGTKGLVSTAAVTKTAGTALMLIASAGFGIPAITSVGVSRSGPLGCWCEGLSEQVPSVCQINAALQEFPFGDFAHLVFFVHYPQELKPPTGDFPLRRKVCV